MLIGIGCDITSVNRFKNKDDNFVKKILSNEEYTIYLSKKGHQKAEFLAGRFAAKEAIIKAIPESEKIAMSTINIFYEGEKPLCTYKNYRILLSISHEKSYAISYVTIEKR
ncbi:MAG: holo-ACP synthase [Firmicutes bacterium]|nr:holo-ACP synthase [Bacillota bacterium]